MKLIGESLSSSLSNLSNYEVYFNEGDIGEVRIYLDTPIYQHEIEQIQDNILSQGVVLTAPISQDARILIIRFKKAIAPLLIIGGVIIALVAGVVGWQIFKSTTLGVPLWAWLVGGGALLYLLLRKPVKKAAPFAIQAGKVYVSRRLGM